MHTRYYLTMASTVAEYVQSDELILMKLSDGRIVGYSSEFQYCTSEIAETSEWETRQSAKWFGVPAGEKERWVPATLDEIKALGLGKFLIGSKVDMEVDTPIVPIE
jgi:hypothetical protein